ESAAAARGGHPAGWHVRPERVLEADRRARLRVQEQARVPRRSRQLDAEGGSGRQGEGQGDRQGYEPPDARASPDPSGDRATGDRGRRLDAVLADDVHGGDHQPAIALQRDRTIAVDDNGTWEPDDESTRARR